MPVRASVGDRCRSDVLPEIDIGHPRAGSADQCCSGSPARPPRRSGWPGRRPRLVRADIIANQQVGMRIGPGDIDPAARVTRDDVPGSRICTTDHVCRRRHVRPALRCDWEPRPSPKVSVPIRLPATILPDVSTPRISIPESEFPETTFPEQDHRSSHRARVGSSLRWCCWWRPARSAPRCFQTNRRPIT